MSDLVKKEILEYGDSLVENEKPNIKIIHKENMWARTDRKVIQLSITLIRYNSVKLIRHCLIHELVHWYDRQEKYKISKNFAKEYGDVYLYCAQRSERMAYYIAEKLEPVGKELIPLYYGFLEKDKENPYPDDPQILLKIIYFNKYHKQLRSNNG